MTTFDLEAIRFRLRERAPYFGTAIWRLRPVEDDSFGFTDDKGGVHGTFAVSADGQLIYNPTVDWSFDECVGALCHEIHHLILRHHNRQNGRDAQLWNYAADLEINSALLSANPPWQLPTRIDESGNRVPDVLTPSQFVDKATGKQFPENLMAEQYYNLLIDNAQTVQVSMMATPGAGKCGFQDDQHGNGSGDGDDPDDSDGNGPSQGGLSDIEIDGLAKRIAEEVTKNRGTAPASLERWADKLLNPTIPWQSVLRAYTKRCINIVSGGASDYSFMHSDDRRSDGDLILPKMITYKPEVAAIVDTSGSISKSELIEMMTEVHGVVKHLAQRISVTAYDAAPHETHKVSDMATLKNLPLSGGGGTDMGGALTYSATLRPRPNIVIVYTDGETPWLDTPPRGTQVIVVLTSRSRVGLDSVPEWARVLKIGGDDE